MNSFSIITEVTCDLTQKQVNDYNLITLPMSITINDNHEFIDYSDHREMSLEDFTAQLKQGALPKTTQVAYTTFYNYFEAELKQERDILYLGFSSAMSGGYSTAQIVIEDLLEHYPQRKIISVDTLCASIGQGLVAIKASQARANGKSLEETAVFAKEVAKHTLHFFTIQDLEHLKRGGRISSLSATFGTLLNVKPLLKVFDDGSLKNYSNVRGRNKAIRTICDEMLSQAFTTPDNLILIGHIDALDEAKQVKQYLLDHSQFTDEQIIINPAGMVIGSHVGVGFLALVTEGSQR